jgi:hypothetical protein
MTSFFVQSPARAPVTAVKRRMREDTMRSLAAGCGWNRSGQEIYGRTRRDPGIGQIGGWKAGLLRSRRSKLELSTGMSHVLGESTQFTPSCARDPKTPTRSSSRRPLLEEATVGGLGIRVGEIPR